jgi:hypothetical protein
MSDATFDEMLEIERRASEVETTGPKQWCWLSNRAFQFSKLLLMNTGNEVGQMAREGNGVGMTKVVSRIFRTFGLAA